MTAPRTSDGRPITVGMRVFGYDYEWGTVTAAPSLAGWWTVTLDSGRTTTYDGSRMRAVMPGKPDPREAPCARR